MSSDEIKGNRSAIAVASALLLLWYNRQRIYVGFMSLGMGHTESHRRALIRSQ
jgi:hypothetical protein